MNSNFPSSDSTIAAIATPSGNGGVGIIRLSGLESWTIAASLSKRKPRWQPGRAMHDWVVDPQDGQLLDEVIWLPFQAPKSFTGEDVMEIHCHGGKTLIQTILRRCLALGAEAAEAGEFTRRAVVNGRLDLTQAESILDLIHAEGEALLKVSASNLYHRAAGQFIETVSAQIMHVQADMTASIDFPDEVDEPERPALIEQLQRIQRELTTHIQRARQFQGIREGVEIALVGLPNAGKSSLFNAFLAADRAIVTEIAGTTRDVLRESVSIKGIPVILSDTAGLRETADIVEKLGVERSHQLAQASALILYVVDASAGLQKEDYQMLSSFGDTPVLLLWNKCDRQDAHPVPIEERSVQEIIPTSATGQIGLQGVLDAIGEALGDWQSLLDGQATFLLSQRQLQRLEAVKSEIEEATDSVSEPTIPLDVVTVPLTSALLELEGLLGRDTTEAMLDSVFSRFCVGK